MIAQLLSGPAATTCTAFHHMHHDWKHAGRIMAVCLHICLLSQEGCCMCVLKLCVDTRCCHPCKGCCMSTVLQVLSDREL